MYHITFLDFTGPIPCDFAFSQFEDAREYARERTHSLFYKGAIIKDDAGERLATIKNINF